MTIDDIRKIGRRLFSKAHEMRNSPDSRTEHGVGAAGDRTFGIDRAAEDIILSGLESLGEPMTVISEETGKLVIKGGGPTVIIDPVDGSKNAVSGIPFYCASLAMAEGKTLGDVRLSYIINLVNGDEFWAEKGSGAYLNGNAIGTQQGKGLYLVAYEAQSPSRDIPLIMPLLAESPKTRCFGSTALDLSYLASGAVSVFVSPSASRSFDFAGGWLLAKEAGGIITDIEGGEISHVELDLKKSSSLLASGNRELHDRSIELLSGKRKIV